MNLGLNNMAGLMAAGLLMLSGCSGLPERRASAPIAIGEQAGLSPHHWSPLEQAQWEPVLFPGKTPTQYQTQALGSRMSLVARADSSVSMLRKPLRIEPAQLGSVRFSWLLPQLIANADMGERTSDDSPVRVVLAFEGDRSTFSLKNALLSELSLTLTGEEMPYATLMYIWSGKTPINTILDSAHTSRLKMIVVDSGWETVGEWRKHERDLTADFKLAYGENPGNVIGIALLTDTDNTKSETRALYGDIELIRKISK